MFKWGSEAILDSDVVVMYLTTSCSSASPIKCNANSLETSSHLTSLHLSCCKETEGITNKDLLNSTWNSAQCYIWQLGWEECLGENEYMCMYGKVPLLFTWNYHNIVNRLCEVTQSCPTLCDPMDCSLPGTSIHGIIQARILEWVAISFSRGSSWPRDWTCIEGLHFNIWATREAPVQNESFLKKRNWRPTFQGTGLGSIHMQISENLRTHEYHFQ